MMDISVSTDSLDSTPGLRAVVEDFIRREQLPASYLEAVEHWFLPLLDQIVDRCGQSEGPMVVGVSGSQGSGKSTLAGLLCRLCEDVLGLSAVSLSLDDFYLGHAERQALARQIHPLLATRGVPGTHDLALARVTLEALGQPGVVAVPRFDKAVDDRLPEAEWPRVQGPVDIILFEGWCLGVDAEPASALEEPVNTLEREEDRDGSWRRYVNDRLERDYPALFGMIDFLVMLQAPSFEKVLDWRQQQENKLMARLTARGEDLSTSRVMDPAAIARFIQHYERITRHGLETLPERADVVFRLTEDQTIAERA